MSISLKRRPGDAAKSATRAVCGILRLVGECVGSDAFDIYTLVFKNARVQPTVAPFPSGGRAQGPFFGEFP